MSICSHIKGGLSPNIRAEKDYQSTCLRTTTTCSLTMMLLTTHTRTCLSWDSWLSFFLNPLRIFPLQLSDVVSDHTTNKVQNISKQGHYGHNHDPNPKVFWDLDSAVFNADSRKIPHQPNASFGYYPSNISYFLTSSAWKRIHLTTL